MTDTLKKTYTAGLGIVALTYEKAEKITKDLIKKGNLKNDKQKEFVNTAIKKAKQNINQAESVIKNKIDELSKKGVPLKEKQDKIIKDITKKAKKISSDSEKRVSKTVKDIMQKSKKTKTKIASSMSIDEKVDALLSKYNIPTQKDIEDINKKLDELISLQQQSRIQDEEA